MKEENTKSRRYCFTVNNYTESDLKRFHKLAESLESHRYICYGLEVAPTTGTKHIQGYIELKSHQRYSFLHKYFKFKKNKKILKFHIEIANGTVEQNKKYSKKEGDFYEFGEPTSQGSRTDLIEIKRLLKENPKDLNKIIDERVQNYQQLKFAQSMQPIYFRHRDPDNPPVVYWIFGSTGVGKTRLVYNCFNDVCAVSSYDWLGTDYTQNECLLFDDFRVGNLSFDQVLRITDRYPLALYFKGGQVPLNSPFIVFTSPKSIGSTFFAVKEDIKQLKRRVKEINLDTVADIDQIDLRYLDNKHLFEDNSHNPSF